MNKRFLILGSILLIALLLACCALLILFVALAFVYQSMANVPPSTPILAADLRVIDQHEVWVEGSKIAALSPDGRWLAAEKQGSLCIYETDSLTKTRPIEWDSQRDWRSVVWSPDSQYIAFTEDWQIYYESDLWVLEAATGKLVNLTNDGVSGRVAKEAPGPMDIIPAWSPDSKTLAFWRFTREEQAFYCISTSGGVPKKLLTMPGFIGHLLWSGDGKNVLFTVFSSVDESESGLWMVGWDGQNLRHLVGIDPIMGLPLLVDASAKGDKAMIFYQKILAQDFCGQPNVSYCALVDLQTGAVEPLKQATSDAVEFYGPLNATFSPDGSKILYVYRDANKEARLAVRDMDGDTENILLTYNGGEIFVKHNLGLTWASNDVVYIATSRYSGLLLSLGANDGPEL